MIKLAAALVLASLAAPAAAMAQSDASAAPPSRAELTASLESRFKTMDKNSDGTLDRKEIEAANAMLAEQAAAAVTRRLEQEFAELDSNKDGMISLAEFKAVAPPPRPTPVDTTLQQLDADKDGKISLAEFSRNMLAAFDRADSNRDGTLSPQEARPDGR